MRIFWVIAALVGVCAHQACAQTGPDRSDLDVAVKRGGIATLAPLCGIRDDRWSEDLRKAAMQDATKAPSPDERALASAPGGNLAAAALGYADVEATEDFAELSPEVACAKLSANPDLRAADRRVELFRADLSRLKPAS